MQTAKLIFVNRFFYPDESATSQILTDLSVALASAGARVRVICSRVSIKGGAELPPKALRPELEGLIVPSKFYGIAAAGRPVIAVSAEDGEIAKIVRGHGIGRVVVPADVAGLAREILELAGDRYEVEALGRRARQVLETHYSRAAAIGRWKALLAILGDFAGHSKVAAHPGNVAAGL